MKYKPQICQYLIDCSRTYLHKKIYEFVRLVPLHLGGHETENYPDLGAYCNYLGFNSRFSIENLLKPPPPIDKHCKLLLGKEREVNISHKKENFALSFARYQEGFTLNLASHRIKLFIFVGIDYIIYHTNRRI